MKWFMWLLAGLKFSKLFITVGTMALSVIVYSFVFGWAYALGFVLLLLVHELGHYVAARRSGLKLARHGQLQERLTRDTQCMRVQGWVGCLRCCWKHLQRRRQMFWGCSVGRTRN